MSETEAKEIISSMFEDTLLGEKVVCIERKAVDRSSHEAVFAVIFKANTKEQQVVDMVKDLSRSNPDFLFGGSEVDNKFDMEFVAILIRATIKE